MGDEIKIITGNEAAAYAAKLCRPGVVSAYPITPQTQVVEAIASFIANKEMDCEFIRVESEHSAMASLIGASQVGERTFTATSSQGLAYMHEMIHWAAAARTPVVLANINRSMGPPWNIYGDQNDSLSERDTGWIQFYAESAQEVLDSIIQGFALGEKVALPVMVNLDAFFLSHVAEPVVIPDQAKVDAFLPPYEATFKLDVLKPMTFGALVAADAYSELRAAIEKSMDHARRLAVEVDAEFKKTFGRGYGIVETYAVEDAEVILVTSATITSTVREVVKALRNEGEKVGLLKIRMFRPFPYEEVSRILKNASRVGVIDRNISFGAGGIFAQEIRSAMFSLEKRPLLFNFIAGLGGRDVSAEVIFEIYEKTKTGKPQGYNPEWIGLKEIHDIDLDSPAIKPKCEGENLVNPGGRGCPGCGASWGLDKVINTMGRDTIVTIPACCSSIITGDSPNRMLNVPAVHVGFATAGASASGIKRALVSKGLGNVNAIVWAGDGGTFDIGIQALSGAAERNEDLLYICYDNEAYMNTGVQRSSATPPGAITSTTPPGDLEKGIKKNMMEIMAAHRIPYCATASAAFPEDFQRKLEIARDKKGTRFIHFYSPCPPGHRIDSKDAIKLARLAVECRVFALYEIYDGRRYVLNYEPKGLSIDLYLKPQGRFSRMTEEDYKKFQEMVNTEWDILIKKVRAFS
jgi:pyruvate ferredoxin oxidoreductase alpha subunit